jgi:HAUS augmin-like complex subunit 1
MAQLSATNAIFSPSVARIAASTAKDWNYVDTWLSSKFHGRTPPSFERNTETLKALLALVALNEAADEEHDLLSQHDVLMLRESASRGTRKEIPVLQIYRSVFDSSILDAVEVNLTREGKASLDAMNALAQQFSIAFPKPDGLGSKIIDLQGMAFEIVQARERTGQIQKFASELLKELKAFIEQMQAKDYSPSHGIAKYNLDIQRRIKALSVKLPELGDRLSGLCGSTTSSHPAVTQIAAAEQHYLDLVAQMEITNLELGQFEGLPQDTETARANLEDLRTELRHTTRHRDLVFEGLVERESPRKAN